MAVISNLADNIDELLWFGLDDPRESDEEARASVASEVAKISGLKPFPAVAAKILQELSGDAFSIPRVSNLMESDPALASIILRLVNSALYGTSKTCTSVNQAVIRIGARRIRELVAAAATLQMFHDAQGVGITFRDHCAATAAIVRVLGQHHELPGSDALFLAGLLHDVGKLLLMETREFDYNTLSPQLLSSPDALHTLEREQLGYDHAVLGANVMRAWQIPDPVPQIVAWHHQPMRAYAQGGDIGPQVALLRIADQIAWYLSHTTMPSLKFNDALVASADGSWIGLTSMDLDSIWVRMVEARAEVMQIFG